MENFIRKLPCYFGFHRWGLSIMSGWYCDICYRGEESKAFKKHQARLVNKSRTQE